MTSETSTTTPPPAWTPQPGKALVLRTSRSDRTSHKTSTGVAFTWPESGPVEAPDWDPAPKCGYGLHGLLWGAGDSGSILHPDGVWQVVEVDAADVVQIDGKVKYPRGVVLYSGDRKTAADLVSAHAPAGTQVHWGTATAGHRGTATAGENGLIVLTYYDATEDEYRRIYAIVGQDGIEAGLAYRVENGAFVLAEQTAAVTA